MTITNKDQLIELLKRIKLYDSEYTPQDLIEAVED